MVKVSIIIPVYNCEQYLRECIESVYKQTLQEWEVICIDDGSTDQSERILREFEERDVRVKVYKQQNQGAGVARNLGLQHAKGEYIAFLDADDYYFDADALEQMYEACIIHNVNACGSMIKLLRNGVVGEDEGFRAVKLAAVAQQVLDYREFQFDYGYYGFIFKAAVLRAHEVIFPPYRRFQDPPFFVKAMFSIGKFCFINKSLYCYRTPNVAVRFSTEKTLDLLKGLKDNLEFAKVNHLNLLFERTLQRLEVEYSNIICNNIVANSIEILELLIEMNKLVKSMPQKADYVILPLQKILGSVSEAASYRREQFQEQMTVCKRIYVYGAGNATTDFLTYLQNQDLFGKVAAIIVTSKEGNPEEIEGIPVISVDEFQYVRGDLVLITVTSIYREEIARKLAELQIAAYEFVDASMLCK